MSKVGALMAEQRRRIILEILEGADGKRSNDGVLAIAIERLLQVVPRDLVRSDIGWLEQHALVTSEDLAPEADIWVVRLTDRGSAVARGMGHIGVAAAGLP